MKRRTLTIFRIITALLVLATVSFFIFALWNPQASWPAWIPLGVIRAVYIVIIIIEVNLVLIAITAKPK